MDTEFNVADPFDSEIFEWTQRACSPELCSSPMEMQVWHHLFVFQVFFFFPKNILSLIFC